MKLNEKVLELKKQMFLDAYRQHSGNMSAVKHVLGISARQAYKLHKMFSKDYLCKMRARAVLDTKDPVLEWAVERVILSRGNV